MDEKKKGIFKTYMHLYRRFIRIRGNPRQIALGFALGVFVGMSPTMGIQIILAVFFAAILGWNKIAASISVWISNVFTAPLLYTITYIIGAKILGMKNTFEFSNKMNVEAVLNLLEKAPKILLAMTVGGAIVGLPMAVAAYFIAYHISNLYQTRIKEAIVAKRSQFVEKRIRSQNSE